MRITMKRLIDANKYREEWLKFRTFEPMLLLDMSPTVLTIPDNPTNGDMIKALFPNIKFNEKWKATRHFELQSEQGHIEITGIATSDWWNSPFEPQKSEVEDGNVD